MLDPSLRGKPIGIRQKYLLVTCNYTARSLGVRKMESLVEVGRGVQWWGACVFIDLHTPTMARTEHVGIAPT